MQRYFEYGDIRSANLDEGDGSAMSVLLQISHPNRDDGRVWYRCELTIVSGVSTVTRTEWDVNGNVTSVTVRPATDYEISMLAEPNCPLVDNY